MDHHDSHPHVNYFGVFIALCICTFISVVFDLVPLPKTFVVVAVLAIALAKALFVMTYFMHLKFEGNWKFVILLPTAILGVGLMIALAPDVAMHYYTNDAAQVKMVDHGDEDGEGHGSSSESHDAPADNHGAGGHH